MKICIITHEVTQGSLLGPRLFSPFVNDLPNATTSIEICLFADDSTFYSFGSKIEEVIYALTESGKQNIYTVL